MLTNRLVLNLLERYYKQNDPTSSVWGPAAVVNTTILVVEEVDLECVGETDQAPN